ncbi:MAG: hypothetical protein EA362_05945 [Saprospirales bacterium]|nr:MAG: hypothetical protein EA362_05945 [Saprospirales bacterium]
MSIPKEPRQLMITIMYLVLTAMLALNVSAEVFNAFKLVDESLVDSNAKLYADNQRMPDAIATGALRDPENFQIYADLAPQVREKADGLVNYLEELIEEMIEEAGGWVDRNGKREINNPKHTDAASRVLVTGEKGADLLQTLVKAQDEFLAFIPENDLVRFSSDAIAISVDPDAYKDAETPRESWEDFMFSRMPLQAVLPIFRKFINDVRLTENNILSFFMQRVGGDDIIFDDFRVVAAPSSSYIIRGETYEADLFLSAASTSVDNMEIFVNGNRIPIDDGVGRFRVTPTNIGANRYTAEIRLTNPATGNVDTYTQTFEYEVGLRSANVAAEMMNVFYIGVDNPVSISAAGIPTAQLNVQGEGAGITMTPIDGNISRQMVRVTQPGEAKIILSGGGLERTEFNFRVRRIPDPVARLGTESGGGMGDGQFKAQRGVIAHLENFDFDARCEIAGFQLVRVARRQDPEIVQNAGGSFDGEARRLIDQASPGDRYFFENVRARCPGDTAPRRINDMVWNIR